jgi:hypothetical protein
VIVKVDGSVDGGPPSVADTGGETATFSARLGLSNGSAGKSFVAATGVLKRQLSSPVSFIELDGVGTAKTVTKGTFLYVKTVGGGVDLRLTSDDGSGGDVVAVIPVNGPLVLELPDSKFLKLLEAKGSVGIEYLVTGPA